MRGTAAFGHAKAHNLGLAFALMRDKCRLAVKKGLSAVT